MTIWLFLTCSIFKENLKRHYYNFYWPGLWMTVCKYRAKCDSHCFKIFFWCAPFGYLYFQFIFNVIASIIAYRTSSIQCRGSNTGPLQIECHCFNILIIYKCQQHLQTFCFVFESLLCVFINCCHLFNKWIYWGQNRVVAY